MLYKFRQILLKPMGKQGLFEQGNAFKVISYLPKAKHCVDVCGANMLPFFIYDKTNKE